MAALALLALLALAWPSSALGQETKLLLASAARTATTTTDAQVTPGPAGALHVYINLSAGSGYSVQPVFQVLSPVSGTWLDVADLGPALTANAVYCYTVGPMNPNGADGCYRAQGLEIGLPVSGWRLAVEHADATPATYSLGLWYAQQPDD